MAAASMSDHHKRHEMLQSLQVQKKVVEDLTDQLMRAQLEYARLEGELNGYQASIAPIQRCPDEVLEAIFESFTNKDSRKVAHLLTVSRRWHRVAINAPNLWNHITVEFGRIWNLRKASLSVKNGIRVCLQRSGSVALHVTLDLKELELRVAAFERHLTTCLLESGANFNYAEARGCVDALSLRIWSVDSPCYSAGHISHIFESISLLVGEGGEHMKRWSTLNISLPLDELQEGFWPLLNGPTPSLTTLHILNAGRTDIYREFGSLPCLSSLEELTIRGKTADMQFLSLRPASLRRLSLECHWAHRCESILLSHFTYIEELTVQCRRPELGNTDPDPEASSMSRISLPHLRGLTLRWYKYSPIIWDVPTLENLILCNSVPELLKGLPNVQALHVYWEGPYDFDEMELVISLLTKVMAEYKYMRDLTIPAALKAHWKSFADSVGLRELGRVIFGDSSILDPESQGRDTETTSYS